MPTKTEADVIDARGLRCPWPVIRVAKALREQCGNSPIIIVADDPIAPTELAAFAKEQGLTMSEIDTDLGRGFQLSPVRSEAQ